MMSINERFWSKVRTPSGPCECWEWIGHKDKNGYGLFDVTHYKRVKSHRYSYEMLTGLIPNGLVIDHLCKNPSCINPTHLEPVTQRENILRGESFAAKEARQTHCKNGHPLSGDNLSKCYIRKGMRCCRVCINSKERERKQTAKMDANTI